MTTRDDSQGGLVTYSESTRTDAIPAQERTIIKGLGASRGSVVGQAVRIVTRGDARRVQRGNIIITAMTTPEHIDAMQRAGGVVTSTGGITCHAAIVMREMGKPSVVGAGRGVLDIKDGTWLRVDGSNGEVEVLPD